MLTDKEKAANTEWVSFNSELTRKVYDQVTKYMTAFENDKIDAVTFYRIINVLWDTTAGLVEAECLRSLEAIHAELRQTIARERIAEREAAKK
jgi:hypothetical protein